jgi:hypothetical protein
MAYQLIRGVDLLNRRYQRALYGKYLTKAESGDLIEALWANATELFVEGEPGHGRRLVFSTDREGDDGVIYHWNTIDLTGFKGTPSQKGIWIHVYYHTGLRLCCPPGLSNKLVYDLEDEEFEWVKLSENDKRYVNISLDDKFKGGVPVLSLAVRKLQKLEENDEARQEEETEARNEYRRGLEEIARAAVSSEVLTRAAEEDLGELTESCSDEPE